MALEIPPELNLFHVANTGMADVLDHLSRFQAYLDDWADQPTVVKERVKTRFIGVLTQKIQFLRDIRDYVQAL